MPQEHTIDSSPALVMAEVVTPENLLAQIGQLQEFLARATEERNISRKQRRLIQARLAYFTVAKSVRKVVAATLRIRVGGVLVGAALLAGLFLVLTHSWFAWFCGLFLGAAILSCLIYLPSNEEVPPRIEALEKQLAECRAIEEENHRLESELAIVREKYRQIIESQHYRLQKLLSRNWKAMRGPELEQFLAEAFTELRYGVEQTGGAGDQGVDLILGKGNCRIAVQVKGYLDSVPNTAIQEAFTGMTYHSCVGCAVITNSRFTSGGKSVAQAVGCALIDEDTLPKLILGQIDLWQLILSVKA